MAGILGKPVDYPNNGLDGMPLAFEFVDAHPKFYKAFVTDLCTAQYHANHGAINCHVVAGGSNWGEGDLKYFRMFMQLDIKKYSEGKIKQADFASFFEITTKSNSYVYQDVDPLQVFAPLLMQTTCCLEPPSTPSNIFGLSNAELIESEWLVDDALTVMLHLQIFINVAAQLCG